MIEAGLNRHDFIAGADFTLCDIPWGVHAHRWFGMDYQGLSRPEMPALRAWYDRLCQRPAYQHHVVATPIV
jgi:glutathione S-transferase